MGNTGKNMVKTEKPRSHECKEEVEGRAQPLSLCLSTANGKSTLGVSSEPRAPLTNTWRMLRALLEQQQLLSCGSHSWGTSSSPPAFPAKLLTGCRHC